MRKDRLYFLTFLSIATIFLAISFVALNYFVRISSMAILESQMAMGQLEVKQISSMIGDQVKNGLSKEKILSSVQKSIQDTDSENMFISVFDWSGKIICHPKKIRIGQFIAEEKARLPALGQSVAPEYLYLRINENKNADDSFEIIGMHPVENSDWILLLQANVYGLNSQINGLQRQYYLVFGIMGLLMVLSSFFAVRIIGSIYEKKLELKNKELENELLSLSKLNADLMNYQKKVEKKGTNKNTDQNVNEKDKTRILTYLRNELVPISVERIAYVYLENTITYVVCFDGSKSTTNQNLDEIYTNLNTVNFYRANRQFIIAIKAIRKIIPYGNNQLKILVKPDSDVEIVISKNKAAEFKQWLNL